MGRYDQKRIIRKIDLEKFISQIAPHPNPQAYLEQYTTTEVIVATILYLVAYSNADIPGKTVLDLGCGTGRFALGAAYLGAKYVVGIDIDRIAIKTAYETSKRLNLNRNINWIIGDISVINGYFDTVLQNPPFGIQKRYADRKFLKKALEVGKTVYSIHSHSVFDKKLINQFRKNSSTLIRVNPSAFLQKYIETHNGNIRAVYSMLITIPKMFNFHKKQHYSFVIDLYWIERCE
jgi:putative methylase